MSENCLYPEPEWGESQPALPDASSLCAIKKTPFIITGILLRLLQYHFSDPDNIENPLLKCYIWNDEKNCDCLSEDNEESKILIAPGFDRDFGDAQTRPALYVNRGEFTTRTVNPATRNRAVIHKDRNNIFDGVKYQVEMRGKHQIIAVGLTGGEAENIAEEVFCRMLHFYPVIRDDIKVGHFFPTRLSSLQEIPQEAKKSFFVTMTIDWAIVYRWIIKAETPLLKRLELIFSPLKDEVDLS
jgi:hypothetical protein